MFKVTSTVLLPLALTALAALHMLLAGEVARLAAPFADAYAAAYGARVAALWFASGAFVLAFALAVACLRAFPCALTVMVAALVGYLALLAPQLVLVLRFAHAHRAAGHALGIALPPIGGVAGASSLESALLADLFWRRAPFFAAAAAAFVGPALYAACEAVYTIVFADDRTETEVELTAVVTVRIRPAMAA